MTEFPRNLDNLVLKPVMSLHEVFKTVGSASNNVFATHQPMQICFYQNTFQLERKSNFTAEQAGYTERRKSEIEV